MPFALAKKSVKRPAAKKPAPRRAAPALPAAEKPIPPIQTKLAVGPARDRFEQEADRVADRVMRAVDTAPMAPPTIAALTVQRIPEELGPGPDTVAEMQRAPEQTGRDRDAACTICAVQRQPAAP